MERNQLIKFLEIAKGNLVKHKALQPVAFLEDRNSKVDVVALDFNDDKHKELSFKLLEVFLATGKFKSFTFISDCFYLEQKTPEMEKLKELAKDKKIKLDKLTYGDGVPRPSESPHRKQCIMLIYKDDKGKQFQISQPYEMKDKKYQWKKKIVFDKEGSNMGGRVNDIWK